MSNLLLHIIKIAQKTEFIVSLKLKNGWIDLVYFDFKIICRNLGKVYVIELAGQNLLGQLLSYILRKNNWILVAQKCARYPLNIFETKVFKCSPDISLLTLDFEKCQNTSNCVYKYLWKGFDNIFCASTGPEEMNRF